MQHIIYKHKGTLGNGYDKSETYFHETAHDRGDAAVVGDPGEVATKGAPKLGKQNIGKPANYPYVTKNGRPVGFQEQRPRMQSAYTACNVTGHNIRNTKLCIGHPQ
jgi:hypothetical protein